MSNHTIIVGGNPAFGPVFLADNAQQRVSSLAGLAVADQLASNTWFSIEAPDVFSAVGYPGFFGTVGQVDATENPDIAAIVGDVPPIGVMRVVENPDVFSAFGTQPIRGILLVTERPDRMTAAGIGYGEDGVWFSTEAQDIFAAAGFGPVTGAFVTSEAADRFQAFGAGVTRVRRRRNLIVT